MLFGQQLCQLPCWSMMREVLLLVPSWQHAAASQDFDTSSPEDIDRGRPEPSFGDPCGTFSSGW